MLKSYYTVMKEHPGKGETERSYSTTALPGAAHVWHSFTPFKHRFHAWLSLRRRCWTADRRLRRGLPSHVLCPLCGTVDETADHISLQCAFSHAIWTGFGRRAGLDLPPPSADSLLPIWWRSQWKRKSNWHLYFSLSMYNGYILVLPRRIIDDMKKKRNVKKDFVRDALLAQSLSPHI
jgi:hypothetical protein